MFLKNGGYIGGALKHNIAKSKGKTHQGGPLWGKVRPSKYRSIRAKCSLDHSHASKLEADYCNRLRVLAKMRQISGFWVQKRYNLTIRGFKICDHVVDFLVAFPDGRTEVHETKGYKTQLWKIKVRLFRVCYPGIPYKIIERG